jgi:hypothetical protein
MLERTQLRLAPWASAAEPGRWLRAIQDGDGSRALGVVRTRDRRLRQFRKIEVFETDDEALVLSLAPAWFGSAWHVRDSEGNFVGTLSPHALLDPAGHAFAERAQDPPDRWRLREPTGREYASLVRAADGILTLHFTDVRLTNPFLRMMVLGSFLLLDPMPRSSRQSSGRRLD